MQPQGVVMVNGTNRQQPVPVAAGTGQAGGLQRKHRAHCVTVLREEQQLKARRIFHLALSALFRNRYYFLAQRQLVPSLNFFPITRTKPRSLKK